MRAAALSLVVFAALWGVAQVTQGLNAGVFGAVILLLASPLTLVGAYAAAIRRAHRLIALERDGWVFRALSGPVLRVGLSFVGALMLACVMMLRLVGQGWAEWAALGVTAVSVPLAAQAWRGAVEVQIAPAFRLAARLRAGRIIGAGLALAFYSVWLSVSPDAAPFERPDGPFRSALVEQSVLISGQWRLLEAYALGQLSALGAWGRGAAVLAVVLGNLALVWAATGLVAAMMLPRKVWPVAFAPAGETMPASIGWSAAVVTLLAGFVFVPLLATAELALRQVPVADRPSQVFVTQVEEIGGQFFEPGTIAELTGRRLAAQAAMAPDHEADLRAAIDAGFDRMGANVDPFLDWYYSLPAEYARIGHLLAGDFEAYLTRRIEEHLAEGAPFDALQVTIERIEAQNAALLAGLEDELAGMAEARRIAVSPEQSVVITAQAEAAGLTTFGGGDLATAVGERLRTRLAVTGGAGLAGAVTAAVMAKIGAKGIAKIAAKAAVKVAASKTAGGAAGVGAGSVVGGIVGSVVPGLGTAVGAAVGGAIGGVALGLGTDALLLQLEESLHREDLAASLHRALDEARLEAQGLITEKSGEK